MPLKSVVETLDGMSDELKPMYAEVDGNFVLQVEGINELPEVSGLKKAYDAEMQKRKDARAEVESLKLQIKELPEDFNIETWKKAKEGKPDEAAIEAAKVELRKTLEGERDDWKGKYEGEVTKNRTILTDTHLTDALTKAGVTESVFLEAARTSLSTKVQYNDENQPYFESDIGPASLSDYIAKWATTDGKPFVTPPKGGDTKTTDKTVPNGKESPLSKVPGFSELPAN